MSETEDIEPTISETIEEISEDLSVAPTLDKSIQKPKKPRTEKQIAALRKAQEARKLKALKKKQLDKDYMEDSEYFKKLTPAQRKHLKDLAIDAPPIPHKSSVPRGTASKVVFEEDPETEEDEVIVVKRRKPKKKKKKQKIIYEDVSDSSDEEPIVKQIQKPKKSKVVEEEFSDEEPFTDDNSYYAYQHRGPLTYGSIARFL